MKRKYADPIQHTVYKDGWNDALKTLTRLAEEQHTEQHEKDSIDYDRYCMACKPADALAKELRA